MSRGLVPEYESNEEIFIEDLEVFIQMKVGASDWLHMSNAATDQFATVLKKEEGHWSLEVGVYLGQKRWHSKVRPCGR